MDLRLSIDDIEAALAYSRWLHAKQFGEWLRKNDPIGLPREPEPVFLNDRGKNVYAQVLQAVKREANCILLTGEGERKAVVQALCEIKARGARRGGAKKDWTTKRAELRLSSISKFVSAGRRTIQGLATSNRVDRVGDIVEPKGGRWDLPVPMLWQHKHDQPIGWVRKVEARREGLWITAELATGIGKADEAWAMIEAGLVDSFSIGFQADNWTALPEGGKRFTSWTLLEVSVVTIPANPDAKIRRGHEATARLASGSGGAVPLRSSSAKGGVTLISLGGTGVKLRSPQ